MPNYGEAKYWNRRYSDEETSEPFDWLFDYADLSNIFDQILPDRNLETLLVGAGNAPFSPELYSKGGYRNLVNIDLSDVVVEKQRKLYPEQQWLVMDVRKMSFADEHFPVVLDKSLIDTLLCYKDSLKCTMDMLTEIHRVLAPGGRYVTLSLHPVDDVIRLFTASHFKWTVSGFRIPSSRWNEGENRKKAFAHTLIICDKADNEGKFAHSYPLELSGVFSDEEYNEMMVKYEQVNLREALKLASVHTLCALLDSSIAKFSNKELKHVWNESRKVE